MPVRHILVAVAVVALVACQPTTAIVNSDTIVAMERAALLTFNLVSYQKQADGSEKAAARWNSTETYARVDGEWRIIHSHWSFIRPELKPPVTEETPKG